MSTSTATRSMVTLPSDSFASALKQTLQNPNMRFLLTHYPENVNNEWCCQALRDTTQSFVRKYTGSSGQAESNRCLEESLVDCTIDISQVGIESVKVIASKTALEALKAFADTMYITGVVPSIELHPEDGWIDHVVASYSRQSWEAGNEAEVIPQGGGVWQTQESFQAEPIKVKGIVRMDPPSSGGLHTTGKQSSASIELELEVLMLPHITCELVLEDSASSDGCSDKSAGSLETHTDATSIAPQRRSSFHATVHNPANHQHGQH